MRNSIRVAGIIFFIGVIYYSHHKTEISPRDEDLLVPDGVEYPARPGGYLLDTASILQEKDTTDFKADANVDIN